MIVVTGATGKVGRPLVQLLAEGGEQVTAVSRRASSADLPEGVRHVQADLADRVSLKPALDGADALFLLLAGELLSPDGRPDLDGILDDAKAAGVRRVVLLSSQSMATRPEAIASSLGRSFEDAVRGSGLEWTILQPGGFDSNAFAYAEMVRSQRAMAAPFGDVGLPLIDPADIAEVAAVVLREEGHAHRSYVLTGPEPVTPRQQAKAIGDAIGSEVRFVELTRDQARAAMLTFMPEAVVEGTLDILGEPTISEQQVSPAVEQILGRTPRTFADWAARNIAAFQ